MRVILLFLLRVSLQPGTESALPEPTLLREVPRNPATGEELHVENILAFIRKAAGLWMYLLYTDYLISL